MKWIDSGRFRTSRLIPKLPQQVVQITHDGVEEFVHEFGFGYFGDVSDDPSAGFGVGAGVAGEYQDAPDKSFLISYIRH